MKWIEQKAQYQKRFDELAEINIKKLIAELNILTQKYITHGGITENATNATNPEYIAIETLTKRIKDIKDKYSKLNDDIVTFLSNESKDKNLPGLLTENGELQKQILKLEKIQEEMKVDVDSAIARDELLRSKDTNINHHGLFILDRPIRRGLIPYLWVVAVLFIGVGLIIFRMKLPNLIIHSGILIAIQMFIQYITSRGVLAAILAAALIVIIFLSLKIAGVFG